MIPTSRDSVAIVLRKLFDSNGGPIRYSNERQGWR